MSAICDMKDLVDEIMASEEFRNIPDRISTYEYVCKILNGRLLEQNDDRLDTSIKNLVNAKEYMLERLGLKGKINSTLAVFSLKQLGWRDQQQVDVGTDTKKSIKITLVKPD